jgi:HNH endonuclease
MEAATRRLVRQRAQGRCEYCRLPQAAQPFVTFHVEHIIARQHGGSDDPMNLCLACERCNAFKGPNVAGLDPATGHVEPLFNPRTQSWPDHFELRGALIVGLSPVGRTTLEVLAMNEGRRAQLRADLIARDEF